MGFHCFSENDTEDVVFDAFAIPVEERLCFIVCNEGGYVNAPSEFDAVFSNNKCAWGNSFFYGAYVHGDEKPFAECFETDVVSGAPQCDFCGKINGGFSVNGSDSEITFTHSYLLKRDGKSLSRLLLSVDGCAEFFVLELFHESVNFGGTFDAGVGECDHGVGNLFEDFNTMFGEFHILSFFVG